MHHSRCLARLLRTDVRSTSFDGHWQRDPGARVHVFRRRTCPDASRERGNTGDTAQQIPPLTMARETRRARVQSTSPLALALGSLHHWRWCRVHGWCRDHGWSGRDVFHWCRCSVHGWSGRDVFHHRRWWKRLKKLVRTTHKT